MALGSSKPLAGEAVDGRSELGARPGWRPFVRYLRAAAPRRARGRRRRGLATVGATFAPGRAMSSIAVSSSAASRTVRVASLMLAVGLGLGCGSVSLQPTGTAGQGGGGATGSAGTT
ncbi:MAG: hypothetical protein JWM82_2630, partial [Myxococcales bacterium]|nr:hypothetical protein [Myxococcales bacterium]